MWYVHFIGKPIIWTVKYFTTESAAKKQQISELPLSLTIPHYHIVSIEKKSIIISIKNIKKALSGTFTLLVSQLYELSNFFENSSFVKILVNWLLAILERVYIRKMKLSRMGLQVKVCPWKVFWRKYFHSLSL